MQCNLGGLFDLILWFVLSTLALVIGGAGLRQPTQVWYWFEWLHWKQPQWFLGIPPEQLSAPRESMEKALAQYPKGAKLIQIICGCMTIIGAIFIILWGVLLLRFLRNCL